MAPAAAEEDHPPASDVAVGAASSEDAAPARPARRVFIADEAGETGRQRHLSEKEQRIIRDVQAVAARSRQMHWRARQPVRKLTAAERHEIQARLYTSSQQKGGGTAQHKPSTSRTAPANNMSKRPPALTTARERAAALELSPSAQAAAAAKAAARAARAAEASAAAAGCGSSSGSGSNTAGCSNSSMAASAPSSNPVPKVRRPKSFRAATSQRGSTRARHGSSSDGFQAVDVADTPHDEQQQQQPQPEQPPPEQLQPARPDDFDGVEQQPADVPPPVQAQSKRKRRAKTQRSAREGAVGPHGLTKEDAAVTAPSPRQPVDTTSRSSAATSRSQYWNREYVPTALATQPLRIVEQPAQGWVALDGTRSLPNIRERRKLNPASNIELFASAAGARSSDAKEVGVPRVTQQWKEGLRELGEPLRPEHRELEQLRTLMRRGEGIGVQGDDWTPYTGPTVDEIIQREISKLAMVDEAEEGEEGEIEAEIEEVAEAVETAEMAEAANAGAEETPPLDPSAPAAEYAPASAPDALPPTTGAVAPTTPEVPATEPDVPAPPSPRTEPQDATSQP